MTSCLLTLIVLGFIGFSGLLLVWLVVRELWFKAAEEINIRRIEASIRKRRAREERTV